MKRSKVYIVAFAPAPNSPNGVGGFDWYWAFGNAVARMKEHLQVEGYDLTYMERDVPFELGTSEDLVTEWIEKNVEMP